MLSAALPLREYLAQRSRIAAAGASTRADQQVRVASLEQQRRLLSDPAYVASLARERLHYVKPGETAYVVLAPPGAATPAPAPGAAPPAAGGSAPWWSQLWGSVRQADGTGRP